MSRFAHRNLLEVLPRDRVENVHAVLITAEQVIPSYRCEKIPLVREGELLPDDSEDHLRLITPTHDVDAVVLATSAGI